MTGFTDSARPIAGTDIVNLPFLTAGATAVRDLGHRFADTVNVQDFGAVGDGVTNDYPAFAAALAALYASKGGTLVVPYTTAGYVLGTSVVIDVGQYSGGGGITLQLNGNTFQPSHVGWCFDINTNYFGANNGLLLGRKPVNIIGGGAIINTTNSGAAGGIRLNDCVGCQISSLTIKSYSSGSALQLFITTSNLSTWCEHNIITAIGTHGCLNGIYTKSANAGGSFLGNEFNKIVIEGTVNNSKLYNFEGTLIDCVLLDCGGYYNQAGATGGNGFYLNGSLTGATIISPWIDNGGGGTQSPLTDIVFGPNYTATLQFQPTLVNTMSIDLPINWRTNLLVVGPTNITGSQSAAASGNAREVLRAPRTYFVSASGSDATNNGLTSGTPFATFAFALSVLLNTIDCAGNSVTIQLADATYTTPIVVQGVPFGLGSASFTIQGTTTATAVISTTGADAVTCKGGARVTLSNLTFQTATSGTGLVLDAQSNVAIGSGCKFAACTTQHVKVVGNSVLSNLAGYTITGNSAIHWNCSNNSLIQMFAGTIDSTGIAYSNVFAFCSDNSTMSLGVAFTTTSSTGTRYFVTSSGLIETFGAGANYLPGNVAGSADAGKFAQYL